jgi:hypothetical protein
VPYCPYDLDDLLARVKGIEMIALKTCERREPLEQSNFFLTHSHLRVRQWAHVDRANRIPRALYFPEERGEFSNDRLLSGQIRAACAANKSSMRSDGRACACRSDVVRTK